MSSSSSNSSFVYTSETCTAGASTNGSTTALECYNIVDTNQLVTSIWLSAAGGVAILMFFSVLRNNRGWREIYHKRATQIHDLIWRPYPFLNRRLVDRCWSFLYPIFGRPDLDIFLSAGIDSLMIVRINLMGIQVLGPLTLLCLSVLLPLYRTGGYLESTDSTGNVDWIMMYTLSNVASKDDRLWAGALRALWACNVADARCVGGRCVGGRCVSGRCVGGRCVGGHRRHDTCNLCSLV